MPGAFKLDHLHAFKPILFRNFSNFLAAAYAAAALELTFREYWRLVGSSGGSYGGRKNNHIYAKISANLILSSARQ